MDAHSVEAALVVADNNLQALGAGPIMELLLSRKSVPVGDYIATHTAVVYDDTTDTSYKSANYRVDVFLFDEPKTDETKYFKIRSMLDSWDTGHWDLNNVVEAKPVEKTIIVWEDA